MLTFAAHGSAWELGLSSASMLILDLPVYTSVGIVNKSWQNKNIITLRKINITAVYRIYEDNLAKRFRMA